MDLISLIVESLWFILPAYFANSAPVDVSRIPWLKKLGTPIDGGLKVWGGRLLGEGKTWRGLFAGIIAGTFVGFIQTLFQAQMQGYYPNLPTMTVPLAFMLAIGTLTGDILASFLKRRINLKPGDPAPILDQLDFIAGAYLFAWIYINITNNTWTITNFWNLINPTQFWTIIIITPFVHMLGNGIAFIWKLKKKPW